MGGFFFQFFHVVIFHNIAHTLIVPLGTDCVSQIKQKKKCFNPNLT